MRWRRRFFVAAGLVLAGCGGEAVEAPAPGALTLVYSGHVDGEIEPCG